MSNTMITSPFMRVTATHNLTRSVSKRTLKQRCQKMSHVLDIVSGGEASTLLENEIKWLSDEEKQHLFVSGVRDCYGHQSERRPRTSNPLAQAATPLKINLGGLRLQESPLLVKERMRQISREVIRGNIKGEIAPFQFH
ncbi:hypothetical protein EMCRGX_G035066 [Ephydatia muelleri]